MISTIHLLAACALLLPSAAPQSGASDQGQTSPRSDESETALVLRVTDASGDPLADASVEVRRGSGEDHPWALLWLPDSGPELLAQGRTDADGRYVASALPPDTPIIVRAAGREHTQSTSAARTGAAGGRLDLGTVALQPAVRLVVEVREADGSPVPGSIWQFSVNSATADATESAGPDTLFVAVTGEDGRAEFAHLHRLPDEEQLGYSLVGEHLEYASGFEVTEGYGPSGGHVVVTLADAGWIEGRITYPDGTPAAWLHVEAFLPNAMLLRERSGVADEMAGTFPGQVDLYSPYLQQANPSEPAEPAEPAERPDVDPPPNAPWTDEDGRYRVRVPAQHMPDAPELVGILIGHASSTLSESRWHRLGESIDLVIPPEHALTGRVLGPDGGTLADATLLVRADEEDPPTSGTPDTATRFLAHKIRCEENGRFRLRVTPGSYRLEVAAQGVTHDFPDAVRVDGPTDLGELRLPGGREVRITVGLPGGGSPEEWHAVRVPGPDKEDGFQGLTRTINMDASGPLPRARILRNSGGRAGEIDGATARWSAQKPGAWRYVLVADGCVPAVVDVDVAADSGVVTREVELEPAGTVVARVPELAASESAVLKLIQTVHEDRHPVARKLEDGPLEQLTEVSERWPDAEGRVRFEDLAPGEYRLIAKLPGRAAARFRSLTSFGPSGPRHPTLTKLTVESGRTVEVEADLEPVGGLRVVARRDGKPLAGALVHISLLEDQSVDEARADWLGVCGVTGADGSCFAPALIPRTTHFVAVRVADDSGRPTARDWDGYSARGPWTATSLRIEKGRQEVVLDLPGGGVRVRPTGVDQPWPITVSLVHGEAIWPDDEDPLADPNDFETYRDAQDTVEQWFLSRDVAEKQVASGEECTILHLPPGRYRIRASIHDHALAMTEPFEVTDGIVDLGELPLQEMARVTVTLDGFTGWSSEAIDGCDLLVLPAEGGRPVAKHYLDAESRTINEPLPAGRWVLSLHDHGEIQRSEPFEVKPGEPRQVRFTITEPPHSY